VLTRLQVDGFKNLVGFSADFGPFTCIAGENGVGKSNVFDAIEFLSLLADRQLMEAAQAVRGTKVASGSDIRDLFWSSDFARPMTLAAEMILPPTVEDDFGVEAKPTSTYVRYEVSLGYVPPEGRQKVGRLALLSESLTPITQGEAPQRLRFPHSASTFRSAVVKNKRYGTSYISTTPGDSGTVISLHQDGGSRGQPRRAAATRAPATVVSTITSVDDPTVLAARREMQSWRRLALEPSAMRTPDGYQDPKTMASDGSHLASALHRIAGQASSVAESNAVYARVASSLDRLSGVRVDSIRVDEDDVRELLSLRLLERGGIELPARNLSEGTLRFLALCVMLEDTQAGGLVCMEEPENGIHPANIGSMIDLARRLAVDPGEAPGPDNPFRQVIVNTHSPAVVQLVGKDDLLFATVRRHARTPGDRPGFALSLVPMQGSWRDTGNGAVMTMADVLPYLTEPPGAQLTLTA
jgi:predicted ATPase